MRGLRRNWRRIVVTQAVGAACFIVGLWTVPHWWCMRGAGAWFDGDEATQLALARGVGKWVADGLAPDAFNTGSERFDGEWLFGTYQMAGLGLAQVALEHPEHQAAHLKLLETCVDHILSEQVKAFDIAAWREDPIATLEGGSGHAAYLGYLNCLLGYARLLDPSTRHAGLNDRITAALARRVDGSPTLLVESYPGEAYPVDNCAVIGSIGLYDRATGADHRALLDRWVRVCRNRYVDPGTGLLFQSIHAETGQPMDAPRGSGTFLGLYLLSLLDDPVSADLYRAGRLHLADTLAGFGVMREYPASVDGAGDIDSGPIVLGYGISATGFAIAGARLHGDREFGARLYATAHLFGAPLTRSGTRQFVAGGPLGDAILLAMLTAQPRSSLHAPRKERP